MWFRPPGLACQRHHGVQSPDESTGRDDDLSEYSSMPLWYVYEGSEVFKPSGVLGFEGPGGRPKWILEFENLLIFSLQRIIISREKRRATG
jgi:hypothetical protein